MFTYCCIFSSTKVNILWCKSFKIFEFFLISYILWHNIIYLRTVELQEKGVPCISNNIDVASRVHILFLCVLPSQFATVAEDIKGHIRKGCIVYSVVSAVPIPRLKQLLAYSNILRPEFEWGPDDQPWDHTLEVTAAFCRADILQLTCPLSLDKQSKYIGTKYTAKYTAKCTAKYAIKCTAKCTTNYTAKYTTKYTIKYIAKYSAKYAIRCTAKYTTIENIQSNI
jgi:hypothetical protein